MRENVAKDLSDSSYDFQRLVWPLIAPWCRGGKYYPVESVTDDGFAKDLDVLAGIDGFQLLPDGKGMRGIASRIQWTDGKDFSTFTVRKARSSGVETELPKRLYQILHQDEGLFYPHITVQAYLSYPRREGQILSVAVALTHELIPYASKIPDERRVNEDNGKWSTFIPVKWDKYKKAGFTIRQYHEKNIKKESGISIDTLVRLNENIPLQSHNRLKGGAS